MTFVGGVCHSREMPTEEYFVCHSRSALTEEEAEGGEEGQWEVMALSVSDSNHTGQYNLHLLLNSAPYLKLMVPPAPLLLSMFW